LGKLLRDLGRDFNFEETEKLRAQTPGDAKPLKVDRKSARTGKESSAELGKQSNEPFPFEKLKRTFSFEIEQEINLYNLKHYRFRSPRQIKAPSVLRAARSPYLSALMLHLAGEWPPK